jgi:G3E family GTPase
MTAAPAGPGRTHPVTTLFPGFRGGNKTSLLDRRVSDPALADAAAIITAFGEIDR